MTYIQRIGRDARTGRFIPVSGIRREDLEFDVHLDVQAF